MQNFFHQQYVSRYVFLFQNSLSVEKQDSFSWKGMCFINIYIKSIISLCICMNDPWMIYEYTYVHIYWKKMSSSLIPNQDHTTIDDAAIRAILRGGFCFVWCTRGGIVHGGWYDTEWMDPCSKLMRWKTLVVHMSWLGSKLPLISISGDGHQPTSIQVYIPIIRISYQGDL